MSLQLQAYPFGTEPCRDLNFILKNYHFSLPFKEGSPGIYELSLMLEELYQIPIESNALLNLSREEVAAMLCKALSTRKRLPKHELNGKSGSSNINSAGKECVLKSSNELRLLQNS